jgi:hypothetical protein
MPDDRHELNDALREAIASIRGINDALDELDRAEGIEPPHRKPRLTLISTKAEDDDA